MAGRFYVVQIRMAVHVESSGDNAWDRKRIEEKVKRYLDAMHTAPAQGCIYGEKVQIKNCKDLSEFES